MNNKVLTIPDWMLKSLKDDSKLRKAEVFALLGYRKSTSIDNHKMRLLIDKGEFPPMYSKGNCGFGLNPNILLWNFGDVKKWIKKHNEKLTA